MLSLIWSPWSCLESFSSRFRPSQCFWNFWDLLPEKPLETAVKFQEDLEIMTFRRWGWKSTSKQNKILLSFCCPESHVCPMTGGDPESQWAPWLGETAGKRRALPSLFPLILHGDKLNTPSESVWAWRTCGFVWPCTYLSWGPSSRCCAEIVLHWGNCSSSRQSSINLMRIITQTLKHRDDVKTASQDQNG